MHQDKVCVAGMHRGNSIRLHNPQPRERWLQSIDGLAPGDIVSLKWRAVRRYRPPHREDGDWNPALLEKTGRLSEQQLLKRLTDDAFSCVEKAFGQPCFYSARGNAAFPSGSGSRSLASLLVTSIEVYAFAEGLRADFTDSKQKWKMAPVEDFAIRSGQRSAKLETGPAILRVGLGRAFQAAGRPPACYLQVNHIFPLPPSGQMTT